MNLSIFNVFLKNKNFTSKIKRSKVTDYAALNHFKFEPVGQDEMSFRDFISGSGSHVVWRRTICAILVEGIM